jgi:hypothetical protein
MIRWGIATQLQGSKVESCQHVVMHLFFWVLSMAQHKVCFLILPM